MKYDAACASLSYLILSKVISKNQNELEWFLNNKNAVHRTNDSAVKMLIEIGKCYTDRNLRRYLDLLNNKKSLLEIDNFLYSHMYYLYDILLESNILKYIGAYSAINLEFITSGLNFDLDVVEKRFWRMILVKEVNGLLIHSDMSLIIFDKKNECKLLRVILNRLKN